MRTAYRDVQFVTCRRIERADEEPGAARGVSAEAWGAELAGGTGREPQLPKNNRKKKQKKTVGPETPRRKGMTLVRNTEVLKGPILRDARLKHLCLGSVKPPRLPRALFFFF